MKKLRALALRMAGVFSKDVREQEFAAELESHVEMQIDDNLRAGMSAEEARRSALLKLGGMEQTRQAYRERGTVPFLENLLYDIRYTLRQWRREPGFAITAAIILALGIGASAAIFSVVNPILFRPFPIPAPTASRWCGRAGVARGRCRLPSPRFPESGSAAAPSIRWQR